MKKDFIIILTLLFLAVLGIYVSCTGTETGKRVKKMNETTLTTPAGDTANAVVSTTINGETAAMTMN
ncbi:hypothetical protein [uncultured Desulfobacter sp.]|uniref:hypothetical protein n=1 Tax=uncultured Desulfobacter sp. TaxID=240139 RepID=UPI002AAB920E|nr:hypothetical protein [uncultured Desulfobacter sp.]